MDNPAGCGQLGGQEAFAVAAGAELLDDDPFDPELVEVEEDSDLPPLSDFAAAAGTVLADLPEPLRLSVR